jgi:hypothetical protein
VADAKRSSEDQTAIRSAAHWPNPAGESAGLPGGQHSAPEGEDDVDRLARSDPKSLRSAAPADGTGVTGTVPPA